jgi:hypothetical protein
MRPDYVAAGSFATGLIVTECIRQAASLDSDKLRTTASELDCYTFYGSFRIDTQSGNKWGIEYCSSAGRMAKKLCCIASEIAPGNLLEPFDRLQRRHSEGSDVQAGTGS